jgi:hypothetical protein
MKLKLLLLAGAVAMLSSCAPMREDEQIPQVPTRQLNNLYLNVCDRDQMPRFRHRPSRPNPNDFRGRTSKEIDEILKDYITKLERYNDELIDVIVKTRERVQQCR